MCRERTRKNRIRLLRTLEEAIPPSAGNPATVGAARVDAAPKAEPVRVFQNEYASEVWGYNREAGDTSTGELTKDAGSVLIFVHGVLTDSVIEAYKARGLAAESGLRAYMSFESRGRRWKGLSSLSPLYDNAYGSDSCAGANEACLLLQCLADVYTATASPPVVVAHSRGARVLIKAAVLWEGLAAVADMEQPGDWDRAWAGMPGFRSVWKKVGEGTRRTLLCRRRAIRDTRIFAVTGCPAVSKRDRGWGSLLSWTRDRSWNLYTERDWFLFFVGNPALGRIPSLGYRNIRFRLQHNSFFGSTIAQRVVANLCRHGGLLRETVDTLIYHNLGRPRLDPDADMV